MANCLIRINSQINDLLKSKHYWLTNVEHSYDKYNGYTLKFTMIMNNDGLYDSKTKMSAFIIFPNNYPFVQPYVCLSKQIVHPNIIDVYHMDEYHVATNIESIVISLFNVLNYPSNQCIINPIAYKYHEVGVDFYKEMNVNELFEWNIVRYIYMITKNMYIDRNIIKYIFNFLIK